MNLETTNLDTDFVIEVQKNERSFFIMLYDNKPVLTWRKEPALGFTNEEEAKTYMKKLRAFDYYKVIQYSLAKNK